MLTLALDYGVLGLLLFVTFFAMGGFRAVRETLKAPASPDRELNLFPALATMILNFLVIKLVFSQVENHSLLFMVMGMIVALSYRRAQEAKVAQTSRAVVMTQAASAAPSRGRQPAYARAGLDPAAISRAPRVR